MPITSKAVWREMAINQPELLHKWQKESPVTYKNLPEHKSAIHELHIARHKKKKRYYA